MDGSPPSVQLETPEEMQRATKVRRFSSGVSFAMMLLCTFILFAGTRAIGVNVERLIRIPDLFNPAQDICLRLSWMKVIGGGEPVRLCTEWINLSDPTGETHQFLKDTEVKQGADGKLYFDHGARVDYRLFVLLAFVIAVVSFGMMTTRYLVSRYRIRLEAAATQHSSFIH